MEPRRTLARNAAILVSLLGLAVPAAATTVRRYDAELRVDPAAGTLAATVTVEAALEPGQREVTLLLNRGFQIASLSCDRPLAGFALHHDRRGVLRYAAEATPLVVSLAEPAAETGTLRLTLAYSGVIAPDAWGVNLVTPEWVELGLYSGWFPLDPAMGHFAYRLTVELPDGWQAVGTGGLHPDGGTWTAADEDVNDIVVIAAPALSTRRAGRSIAIHAAGVPAERLDAAAAAAGSIRERLTELLGPSGDGALDVVFTARTRGGGYVRPGLAVLQDEGGSFADEHWVRYMGHEISHLWWHRAPSTDWQDWLNESFAEVTALELVRERLGEKAWAARLARYRKESAALPPVRGLDRNDEAAYKVLYRKGPVILSDLEQHIGHERFLTFLRAVNIREASNTDTVLAVLREVVSPDAAGWLSDALGR